MPSLVWSLSDRNEGNRTSAIGLVEVWARECVLTLNR
jgi:hypothetical protein